MNLLFRFCIRHHRALTAVGCALFVLTVCLPLIACGLPVWLTDAGSIIALIGSSFTSIAAFVAGLTGNVALAATLATVSAWITKIQTGLTDLDALVEQYQQDANPTVLSDIEATLADIKANLATDFSNLGLPSQVLSVIANVAALALQQLEAWSSLIPAVSASSTAGSATTVAIKIPLTKAQFKAAHNAILAPTGDPEVDAVLAKIKNL